MPRGVSPLRLQATARSFTQRLGPSLNKAITSNLEPEFKSQYDEPSCSYHEIMMFLPLAFRTGQLTENTKRAVLRRVVLRDHESLTRFFLATMKSPACAAYVEELHCHVDLGSPSSAKRLSKDIALVFEHAEHLQHCPISLGILISMREHMRRELRQQPYQPDLDVRFRQAIFLSLLGHLPCLDHLRMTVYSHADDTLAWLRRELKGSGGGCAMPQHYPVSEKTLLLRSGELQRLSHLAPTHTVAADRPAGGRRPRSRRQNHNLNRHRQHYPSRQPCQLEPQLQLKPCERQSRTPLSSWKPAHKKPPPSTNPYSRSRHPSKPSTLAP